MQPQESLGGEMEPGTIADWANFGVAFVALVSAICAGFASFRILRIESQRDGRELDRERRSQAAQVSAWGVCHETGDKKTWTIQLLNGSGAAVFDVHVERQMLDGTPQDPRSVRTLPPGLFEIQHVRRDGRAFDNLRAAQPDEADLVIPGAGAPMVVSITFTDVEGVKWRRTSAGLSELPS